MGFLQDIEGAHIASLRRLGDFRGRRVLEIGCGDGRLTASIAAEASSVFAFDTMATMVEAAARRLERVRFTVASACDVELPPEAFDLALFSWSF